MYLEQEIYEKMRVDGNVYFTNRLYIYKIDLEKLNDVKVIDCCVNVSGANMVSIKEYLDIKEQNDFDYSIEYYNGIKYGIQKDWYNLNSFEVTWVTDKGFFNKIVNFDAEPNLKERMIKAFQTLAKYNNAEKPKEKF